MGKSKQYNKISYEKRMNLIEMVCEAGIPCTMAGRELGISASTAKMIVKKYRDNGKIFEKKEDKLKRQFLEDHLSNASLHNQSPPATPDPVEQILPWFYVWQFPIVDYLPVFN